LRTARVAAARASRRGLVVARAHAPTVAAALRRTVAALGLAALALVLASGRLLVASARIARRTLLPLVVALVRYAARRWRRPALRLGRAGGSRG
jgi:hypothetical protein